RHLAVADPQPKGAPWRKLRHALQHAAIGVAREGVPALEDLQGRQRIEAAAHRGQPVAVSLDPQADGRREAIERALEALARALGAGREPPAEARAQVRER